MVYEHAYFAIDPDRIAEFEVAVRTGRDILLTAPGCREATVSRSVDHPGTYLLRVGWDSLEDHLETFPTTPQARMLTETVGPFIVGQPTVIHLAGDLL